MSKYSEANREFKGGKLTGGATCLISMNNARDPETEPPVWHFTEEF